jgi:hypothetical protein
MHQLGLVGKLRELLEVLSDEGLEQLPYANSRPEVAGISLGEKVRLVMSTPAWDEVMRPVLDAMDAERPKRGPAPSYSSEELEACLLYQRLAGVSTYGKARALIAGDRGEVDRAALGFDHPRKRVGRSLRLVRSSDYVPSEATVWRHKNRFGLGRHTAAYRSGRCVRCSPQICLPRPGDRRLT